MELSQYAELFLSESREHVSAINHLLLALEADPRAREPVEGLFRGVHTIKGMSATMGYRAVADIAHEMENLLDRVRLGRAVPDSAMVDVLFAATDALERSIEHAVEDGEDDGAVLPVVARLRELAGESAAPAEAAPSATPDAGLSAAPAGTLRVRFTVDPASALPAVRAFMAVRAARGLGEVTELDPSEAAMQEADFNGTVRFLLRGEAADAEVEAAIRSAGEIRDVELRRAAPEPAAAVHPLDEADHAALDDVLHAEAAGGADDRAGAAGRARNIRVDLRRLDALVNGVGELVIVRDRMRRLAGGATPELAEAIDQAARLIGELQDEIMQARMAPVMQVFDRFPRLVRDAARSLGKRVDFVIEGKEIELDRSMLDEIGDPVVHLLRNSLDHGIESPADRRAVGKPETGTLRLSAARERSRIVIRVEDDGRGIQRERVLAKAVSRGLVTAEEARGMSSEDVDRLIIRPGFSTAETVTDVSGRGVGLDVVATRVRALGGMLEIESAPGQGTSMTLQLPATLAIVRALLVRQSGETYALPLTHVGETVHLLAEEVGAVKGRTVAFLRDEVIPLHSLRTLLRTGGERPEGKRPAVILEVGEQRVGLEVDQLVGQQEIVVKAFDATADTLRLFSGATILSDGRPALILDAGSLLGAAAHAA
ncbi:chemotaxis protein CheA [Longimicrobium terrae]|uniref:Chemotaxis protein CheA n=1 Tax=Longimicrobium terrae TaxID=1639882 RepID=A0A841H4D0_9BACT|nr:chemotaxis protein CheA [Longimicrobium terrae]MBB4638518.1 two-component system chemotaxis sensor kinase CheA [Longimicrobium terrae]MBB6072844.1 two-component system chemotaxis sensor kinase CheA [Longimicrobium terrae]NNC30539.1 chemotaxis protein CheA [Longimicrobium terrae]